MSEMKKNLEKIIALAEKAREICIVNQDVIHMDDIWLLMDDIIRTADPC